MTNSISSLPSPAEPIQDRQNRQGLRLAAYLSLEQAEVPHTVSERLRLARLQALAVRKPLRASAAVFASAGSPSLGWGDEQVSWWGRIGSVLPLLALVAGLLLINSTQNDSRARELAEVDVALLTDEFPVAAFADPGFLQFLKSEN